MTMDEKLNRSHLKKFIIRTFGRLAQNIIDAYFNQHISVRKIQTHSWRTIMQTQQKEQNRVKFQMFKMLFNLIMAFIFALLLQQIPNISEQQKQFTFPISIILFMFLFITTSEIPREIYETINKNMLRIKYLKIKEK